VRKSKPNPHLKRLVHPIPDAAYALGIGVTSIYELVKEGKLKKVVISGRSGITAESIDALVATAAEETT
jgi:hypothetical protein